MKSILKASSALALIAAALPAWAQDAAAEEDNTAPAEIVVTAQKRSERLQDVPVAVSQRFPLGQCCLPQPQHPEPTLAVLQQ